MKSYYPSFERGYNTNKVRLTDSGCDCVGGGDVILHSVFVCSVVSVLKSTRLDTITANNGESDLSSLSFHSGLLPQVIQKMEL